MSELVVHGAYPSQPFRTLIFFLKRSNIEYTFHLVDITLGEFLSEEFTKINPYQLVPAITHNGFNIWESGAIITYLADVYNIDNQWYPKDPKARSRINAYIHWHHQNMRRPLTEYYFLKSIGPVLFGMPQLTEEQIKKFDEGIQTWYETTEWLLSDTGFVARTEGPTIADVYAFNEVTWGVQIPIDLDAHPKIKSWYESIGSDPLLQDLHMQAVEIMRERRVIS